MLPPFEGTTTRKEHLSDLEYVRYLRDSYPQTIYFLRQWESLYDEYSCEVCNEAMWRMCGGGIGVAPSSMMLANARCVNDLPKVCKTGRYMACVNLEYPIGDSRRHDDEDDKSNNDRAMTYRVHVCNFVPIVLGSKLDLSIRHQGEDLSLAVRFDDTLSGRMGHVFVLDNFWVFSSFISTDARQCHRYRERTKSAECSIRMYVYDRTGKGHMLFIRPNDRALYIRDKLRREVCLITASGDYVLDNVYHRIDNNSTAAATTDGDNPTTTTPVIDSQGREKNHTSPPPPPPPPPPLTDELSSSSNLEAQQRQLTITVIGEFVRDALVAPFDVLSARDFFLNCHSYMLHGVGNYHFASKTSTTQLFVHEQPPQGKEKILGSCIRDIDHLDNKRVSVAPSLYSALLRSFARNVGDAIHAAMAANCTTTMTVETDCLIEQMIRVCVIRYGAMSHRANLLPFISRKTHIRQDWCESMKRQMKSEIRSNRRHRPGTGALGTNCGGAGGGVGGVGGGVAMPTILPSVTSLTNFVTMSSVGGGGGGGGTMTGVPAPNTTTTIKLFAPDVAQDNTKVSQQFYCSKLHMDVEYDHEIVKRMRVVNLNAMTCLRMPAGFERFLSYYNVGNIGNAGRVMTRTHGMRESYIPSLDCTLVRMVSWIRSYFQSSKEESNNKSSSSTTTTTTTTTTTSSSSSFTLFSVNEIPILRKFMTFAELSDDEHTSNTSLSSNSFLLWQFVLSVKYSQPGCVVTVTHLHGRSYCVNVRVAHGIPLCPVNVLDIATNVATICDRTISAARSTVTSARYASFCKMCLEYRSPTCLTVAFNEQVVRTAWCKRLISSKVTSRCHRHRPSGNSGVVLPTCPRHVWFSRHELSLYYQTFDNLTEPRPLMHEIACHGFFSIACYPLSTDISKLIVSINAHRRSLDIVRRENSSSGVCCVGHCDTATSPLPRLRLLVDWSRYGDSNGKFTRLILLETNSSSSLTTTSSSPHPHRLIPKNAIRLLFAFGDMDMLNCEDGYVLNENLTLLAETLFRKKINISCKSGGGGGGVAPVSLVTKMTLLFERGHGARLHIGTLYSPVRINIPCGNDILVYHREKPVAHRNDRLYACDLYLVWNSSFMQLSDKFCGTYHPIRWIQKQSAHNYSPTPPSEDNGGGDDRNGVGQSYSTAATTTTTASAMRRRNRAKVATAAAASVAPPTILHSVENERSNSLNFNETVTAAAAAASCNDCRLYEEYEYDTAKCAISAASVEVFDRFIRVSVRSRPAQQTLKLQNSFGQKGIAHFANLSDLVTERGEAVDVISSMYSLVGRSACGQMLEQRMEDARRIYSRATGQCLGVGGYAYFFISSDFTHNHFIYHMKHGGANPMRMCRLTYEALLENCASSTAFVKGSDFESGISNPYAGMPRTVNNALHCYGVHQRAISLESQRTLALRKRVYDIALLKRLTAMATISSTGDKRNDRRRPAAITTVVTDDDKKRRRRRQRKREHGGGRQLRDDHNDNTDDDDDSRSSRCLSKKRRCVTKK